jgi:hypothetical protein
VYVSQERDEVLVDIHQNRVIPLFKQMPGGLQASLRDSRVLTSNAHHETAERRVCDLNQRVHMVCHVAIRVQSRLESFENFREQLAETLPIGNFEEDVLLMIAAQGDVIHRAWRVNA